MKLKIVKAAYCQYGIDARFEDREAHLNTSMNNTAYWLIRESIHILYVSFSMLHINLHVLVHPELYSISLTGGLLKISLKLALWKMGL